MIDVPGHDRFVRTMVAGATGIDLFLLVVDAAEGPKPQTYEHLEILRLLGVDRGVVAVTKTDATDPERVRSDGCGAARAAPGQRDRPGERGDRRRAAAAARGDRAGS